MLTQDDISTQNGKNRNVIPPPERPSLWKGYFEKFLDPLIIILLIVFVFSVFVSAYEVSQGDSIKLFLEPVGVLVALLLATGVGFIFEVKAEKEFEVLNQVKDDEPVKVIRYDSKDSNRVIVQVIPKKDVCVGDLVRLEAGDEIPADGQLVQSNQLQIDESAFTGEPYVNKAVEGSEEAATLGAQEHTYPVSFLLRGSNVIAGSGEYEVTAVGMETEEGKGAARIQEGKEVKTPLRRQLDVLGRWISTASFVIGILIVLGRMVYFFWIDADAPRENMLEVIRFVLDSIMIAVTLIVVAVPEGLPMSITVSLALSMRKMLKENNLVRKLHACETMGAATIICTDKTGTLTQNRMTVVEHLSEHPLESDSYLALNIAINSTAELNGDQAIGNPTEGALLHWLRHQTIDYKAIRSAASVIEQKPFSSETKYMATKVQMTDGRIVEFYKGAPEIIFSKVGASDRYYSLLESYQNKAYRTLAFVAVGEDGKPLEGSLALVGIADPIREDVRDAIDLCMNGAHVKVIIVTGDTSGTANEIGRQIGLLAEGETDKTLSGPEFAALSDADARERLRQGMVKIISRARPDDKARLVLLLQRNGDVVAVTGDGTNDAPALSKAQVGLSMGDGTARAKEASDITIIDNSFASINKAILWGRSLYQNIRRFIIFQMTINVCACFIVLLGAFIGLDSPLNVTQMLWVNLIMDTFAAGALSSLPADPRVMSDHPRSSKAHILDRSMLVQIGGWGILFFVILTIVWEYLKGQEQGPHLSAHALGLFFTMFVLLQFWNLFNTRYYHTDHCLIQDLIDAVRGRRSLVASFGKGFLAIAAVIFIGQILIQQLAYEMFEVSPLTLSEWLQLTVATSPVLLLPDLFRFIRLKSR